MNTDLHSFIKGMAEASFYGIEAPGSAFTEAYIKDGLLFNNHAGNYGGGLNIDGSESSLFLMGNVVFDSNTARGGGALSFGTSRLINATGAIFRNNRHVFESVPCTDC